ncbi:unnamed protein product [Mytilus edulis]|uniref:Ig-like domain-containing protein n=1 Tax=Mytilus edulis TaxID=6550 RepID=A0A8S3RZM9_MYTED|nr:unnamed protein product [Mytilus edulis]
MKERDNILPVQSCNASQSVDLLCEYNYLTSNFIRWIHSRNGKFIKELNTDFVDESTNTLHFPFCNHDDSGEYTCMLSTDYSLLPSINISVHLLVNASLELERRTYCDTSHSIELKCTLKLVGATPVPWIHSNAGQTIRSLQGRHVNTSNILTIPFCNSQDTGDYTCRWKTDILSQAIMEKSTTLSNRINPSAPQKPPHHQTLQKNSVTVIIANKLISIRCSDSGYMHYYIYQKSLSENVRNEESTYDTISMSTTSRRLDDQADYMEVL